MYLHNLSECSESSNQELFKSTLFCSTPLLFIPPIKKMRENNSKIVNNLNKLEFIYILYCKFIIRLNQLKDLSQENHDNSSDIIELVFIIF